MTREEKDAKALDLFALGGERARALIETVWTRVGGQPGAGVDRDHVHTRAQLA